MKAQENRVRPLRVRPGARFACAGDGLCCTDVHALGPVTRRERETLELISDEVVGYHPTVEAHVLVAGTDGRCLFLGANGCMLHAQLGPRGKPSSCRRFPFGVTATPSGGRITTDHRCPCRSMGERPPITAEAAEEALQAEDGQTYADREAPERVTLDAHRSLPFAEWEARERSLLDALAQGTDPLEVIEADPFPSLEDASWEQVAVEMEDAGPEGIAERGYETRFEAALGWFGQAVRALREGEPEQRMVRPWAEAFDRAEARSAGTRTAPEVFGDWVADDLWAMRWAIRASWRVLGAELGTRITVARHLATVLGERGVRAERAAAEAVTIAELVGTSDWWGEVIRRMKL